MQQMGVQTCFFRRTNMNAPGQPRSWTDRSWQRAARTQSLSFKNDGPPGTFFRYIADTTVCCQAERLTFRKSMWR
jgi:hypothetical protein